MSVSLEVGERVLPSGLTLLAARNPGRSTFACHSSLAVSMRDEDPAKAGLAHFVGECLEEGTQARDGVAFAEAIELLGGHIEGSTAGGVVQAPAENAEAATRLFVEMLTRPAFPEAEVQRVRDEILTEIRSDQDDARLVARHRFRSKVYEGHPFQRPAYGTVESVQGISIDDLRAWHRERFVPAGGYVAIAGPAGVDESLDLLEAAFGTLEGPPAVRLEMPDLSLPASTSDEHVSMAREQIHVFAGHVGVRRADPDYHALLVMDHVLGSGPGFTSRISKSLRDEQGLCYSVTAGIASSAGTEPGVFAAYIGTTEHRQKAVEGFIAEMRRLRAEVPTGEEVADVHNYLTGSYVFGLERNSSLASFLVRAKRFDLGFDYPERYPDYIRAVDCDEVRRVAEKHLHPDNMFIVSAGAG